MSLAPELQTERLLLRRWRPEDRQPFAELNADPRVVEHLPSALSRTESDQLIARIEAAFAVSGFGLWAVEIREAARFAGFIGLGTPRFAAHFTPCVELGWRLAAAHWGQGYATEGARAALAFGFQTLGLSQIVAFTVPQNVRSRRVMEKLNMSRHADDDFDHPALPPGNPLGRHVLYRITSDRLGQSAAQ